MKLLRITDNSRQKKESFSDIENLTNRVINRSLGQLEREGILVFPETIKDAEDRSRDQLILRSVDNIYLTGNIVGFVGYNDERLVIRSRFGEADNDYLFQYLLSKALGVPNVLDLDADADQKNDLFSFLIFVFPYYLKKAVRKGVFKEYTSHKYNDSSVKGTINVSRHIEMNTPFIGKFAYSMREFSYDNHLMELVRHTIEFIKRKPQGGALLFRVKDVVKLVINATPKYKPIDRQKVIEENKKNPVRHAYFREYLALQSLCLMILQDQKHDIGAGTQQIYGILFDCSWLWEEYINSLIGSVYYHPMNKGGGGGQRLFDGNQGLKGLIYPDFISRDSEERTIADAKYKPAENIGNRDYLQVLAYMFRFDAKTGYYLYPEVDCETEERLWMNKGSTFEHVERREDICVVKLGLKIPQGVLDYSSFKKSIEESEQEFKKSLNIPIMASDNEYL